MKILTSQQFEDRFSTVSSMHEVAKQSPDDSSWPIPFEDGSGKQCRVTVSRAREIAYRLLMHVAEHERAQVLEAFKEEQEHVKQANAHYHAETKKRFELEREVVALKKQLRVARTLARRKKTYR
jgi:hypothetical protein